ncbi:MAG: hypothetical protein HN916_19260 [Anaerolineae bacterium]|jgi:hypothetical protein|nr:hypothetical protein [Anaerolineae bacterium]
MSSAENSLFFQQETRKVLLERFFHQAFGSILFDFMANDENLSGLLHKNEEATLHRAASSSFKN